MKYLAGIYLILLCSCANQKALRHEWYKKTEPKRYLQDSLKIKHEKRL